MWGFFEYFLNLFFVGFNIYHYSRNGKFFRSKNNHACGHFR